ncbi:hypothetical protein R1sor_024589 [Riccia sorocarpa]|uniref:Uncharacterized protein n=1 Tax=Riccia sorocarpa TaxID=122646 RepID=A0ABD3GQY8_9MARC
METKADDLRLEGRNLFESGRWTEAVGVYGQYIEVVSKEGGAPEQLVVAYSNRAETLLRLQMYADALEDAEKALDLDPQHLKSLARKARALFGLKLFKETVSICKDFLQRDGLPESFRKTGSDLVREASWKDNQTRFGPFVFTDLGYGEGTPGDISSELEDFVGPIELKRTPGMDRGLFATRDLNEGEILFVASPLTSVRLPKVSNGMLVSSDSTLRLMQNLDGMVKHARRNLKDFSQVQFLVQLEALAGPYPTGPLSVDTPPMEYFKPVNSIASSLRQLSASELQHPRFRTEFDDSTLSEIVGRRLEFKREEMRRQSIQTIEAVKELFRTEPKLRDLTAIQKDWIQGSFIFLYRQLLDPPLASNASKEEQLDHLRLVLEAVRIMRSIEPASEDAMEMITAAQVQTSTWKMHTRLSRCEEIEVLLKELCKEGLEIGRLELGDTELGAKLEPEFLSTLPEFLVDMFSNSAVI